MCRTQTSRTYTSRELEATAVAPRAPLEYSQTRTGSQDLLLLARRNTVAANVVSNMQKIGCEQRGLSWLEFTQVLRTRADSRNRIRRRAQITHSLSHSPQCESTSERDRAMQQKIAEAQQALFLECCFLL